MLDSLDPNIAPEHMFEDGLFGTAKANTSAGRSADRAMVLHQEVTTALLFFPSRHITFFIPNIGQTSDLSGQTSFAGEQRLIAFARSCLPDPDQFLQGIFPQHYSDFTDQLCRKFCVRIWKTSLCGRCKMVNLSRPPYSMYFGLCGHHSLFT